jgi:hypothetical protein
MVFGLLIITVFVALSNAIHFHGISAFAILFSELLLGILCLLI